MEIYVFIGGMFAGLILIAFFSGLDIFLSNRRIKVDTRKEIDEFCKKNDYCFYGCGRSSGGYYGGYRCNSDHK